MDYSIVKIENLNDDTLQYLDTKRVSVLFTSCGIVIHVLVGRDAVGVIITFPHHITLPTDVKEAIRQDIKRGYYLGAYWTVKKEQGK